LELGSTGASPVVLAAENSGVPKPLSSEAVTSAKGDSVLSLPASWSSSVDGGVIAAVAGASLGKLNPLAVAVGVLPSVCDGKTKGFEAVPPVLDGSGDAADATLSGTAVSGAAGDWLVGFGISALVPKVYPEGCDGVELLG